MSINYVIKSNDPEVYSKLQENLRYCTQRMDFMKTVNEYYNKKETTYGCPGVTNEHAAALDAMAKKQGIPYLSNVLQKNEKQIKMLNSMLDRVANKKESLFKGWEFNGGEAIINLANNRLQLKFNEKPSAEVIKALKDNDFNWSRNSSSWLRPLTYKTMSICDKLDFIKPTDGRKVSDIQPKQPKKSEPER